MATKIIEIEGIGPVFAEKLSKAGVLTVEGLLEKGAITLFTLLQGLFSAFLICHVLLPHVSPMPQRLATQS
jgi:hypothetical protein